MRNALRWWVTFFSWMGVIFGVVTALAGFFNGMTGMGLVGLAMAAPSFLWLRSLPGWEPYPGGPGSDL